MRSRDDRRDRFSVEDDDVDDRVEVEERVADEDRVDERFDVREDVDDRFDDEAEVVLPEDPRLADAERPPPVAEAAEDDAVCQRFPSDAEDGRVMPAVGSPSSRFETYSACPIRSYADRSVSSESTSYAFLSVLNCAFARSSSFTSGWYWPAFSRHAAFTSSREAVSGTSKRS